MRRDGESPGVRPAVRPAPVTLAPLAAITDIVVRPDWPVQHARGLLLLPLDQIRPNPANPRRDFDERALDELAQSIRSWGQLQPVVVRRQAETNTFQLICGERRWRAHERAGLQTIWAVERDASDSDLLRLALIENLQRVSLARPEKLAALDQLAELTRVTGLRRTASQLQVDPSWLSRQLAVRRDPVIFPALEAGRLGFGQAAELLRAPSEARPRLLERIQREQASATTSKIRAWVTEARAQHSSVVRRPAEVKVLPAAAVVAPASYRGMLKSLEELGPPRTSDEYAALVELITRARRQLGPPPVSDASPQRSWAEVNCLMCGERAAVIENGTVRARLPGAIRQEGQQLVCGRCGGALTQGERGTAYTYPGPVAATSR